MDKDITVNELADAVLQLAKTKYDSQSAMAFSYGTLTGVFEAARWGFKPIQEVINVKYAEVQKDLDVKYAEVQNDLGLSS
jgi:hypothetical protein